MYEVLLQKFYKFTIKNEISATWKSHFRIFEAFSTRPVVFFRLKCNFFQYRRRWYNPITTVLEIYHAQTTRYLS